MIGASSGEAAMTVGPSAVADCSGGEPSLAEGGVPDDPGDT